MDAIAESDEELTITKNGKPVAKLVPYHKAESLFDMFGPGEVEIHGDIIEPLEEEWGALDDDLDVDYYK